MESINTFRKQSVVSLMIITTDSVVMGYVGVKNRCYTVKCPNGVHSRLSRCYTINTEP